MSVVEITRQGINEVGPAAVRLAELEDLGAHAASVRLRLTGPDGTEGGG